MRKLSFVARSLRSALSQPDRFWFAARSSFIPRQRWAEVFPISPTTLPAWHRRLPSGNAHGPGRPPTEAAMKVPEAYS